MDFGWSMGEACPRGCRGEVTSAEQPTRLGSAPPGWGWILCPIRERALRGRGDAVADGDGPGTTARRGQGIGRTRTPVRHRLRLHPGWIVPDSDTGEPRVSSAAFSDSPDGTPLSMYVERLLPPGQDVLAGHEDRGLGELSAHVPRGLALGIAHTPNEGGPGHVSVFGNKTKRVKRALARACVIRIRP